VRWSWAALGWRGLCTVLVGCGGRCWAGVAGLGWVDLGWDGLGGLGLSALGWAGLGWAGKVAPVAGWVGCGGVG